jgi:proteasome lid subunit RPN8/RPN11
VEHVGTSRRSDGALNVRTFLGHVRLAVDRWLDRIWPSAPPPRLPAAPPEPPKAYEPLARIILTDGVSRSLFEQYAEHRASVRGNEETGWILVGLRQPDEAIVLATLPAGAGRDAGIAHVRFNAEAQALASRILRQEDRRLVILGVVHTHPGSLRHPSQGDLEGDRQWVRVLRGGDGVFGIGTADAPADALHELVAQQPKPHVQTLLGLRFTWYGLGRGDDRYRLLPVTLALGPDLAAPLIGVWPIIEEHAARLERLCEQLAKIHFAVFPGPHPMLEVSVAIAAARRLAARVGAKEIRYGEITEAGWRSLEEYDPHPDRGLFALLARWGGTEPRMEA